MVTVPAGKNDNMQENDQAEVVYGLGSISSPQTPPKNHVHGQPPLPHLPQKANNPPPGKVMITEKLKPPNKKDDPRKKRQPQSQKKQSVQKTKITSMFSKITTPKSKEQEDNIRNKDDQKDIPMSSKHQCLCQLYDRDGTQVPR